tara:strand:- start:1179 stop:1421 length:243 start_codon:yes stop_codon:yes gene_type:complete
MKPFGGEGLLPPYKQLPSKPNKNFKPPPKKTYPVPPEYITMGSMIAKQQAIIDHLKRDNKQLRTNLLRIKRTVNLLEEEE